MILTIDKLKEVGADQFIIDKFYDFDLEGGRPLIDIIKDKKMSKQLLHWIFLHLSIDENELKEYENILNIYNSSGYYMSENLSNSIQVSCSSNIESSSCIENSSRIRTSVEVKDSNDIESSKLVANSSFCFSSECVLESKNVNDSRYIYNSNFVINSNSIVDSSFITNSSCIVNSTQIEESGAVDSCSHLKNCLFCHNIHEKEFYIFNKEISKSSFNLIQKQYNHFMQLPLNIFSNCNFPNIKYNYNPFKFYEELPKNFWEWVKTLPNYDPLVLFSITLNSNLL